MLRALRRIWILLLTGMAAVAQAQADTLCQNDPVGNYHVIGAAGSTFFWDTQGDGLILSGQGNDSVQVQWTGGPGVYQLSVTETSVDGCVGLPVLLQIEVLPPINTTFDQTICNAQLPYSWNGLTFTGAGSQSATLVSAAGCDSIATLNLTVNAQVTSSTDLTICNAQLPYSWNGLTFTGAGSQSATLVSAAGCDSIATLNLTVNSQVTSTTNQTICNNQLPYTWNGLTFTGAGSQSATLVSVAGCDSIATLNLTVNSQVTSTTNQTICNNQLPYTWNGLTFTGAGSQSATLVSAAGCDSIATLNLTVNSQVTSTTNQTICNNQLPYSWNGLIFTGAGSQSATLVSAAGCDSIATLNLTVNSQVTSTTNQAICNNQLPYTWNGLTFTGAGSQSATLVSAAGCDSIATLNLTVNSQVTSTTNQTICNNQLPYSWNGLTFTGAGSQSATLVSAAGCDSIATLNLTVNAILSSTVNASTCSGEPYILPDGTPVAQTGTYPVTLSAASGCDSVVTTILQIINPVVIAFNATICQGDSYTLPWGDVVSNAGTYADTSTSVAGCDSILQVVLQVDPQMVLILSSDTSICEGASIALTVAGANAVLWSPSSSLSDSTAFEVIASPAVNTTYTVIGNSGACSDTAQVTVTVLPLPQPVVNLSANGVCEGGAIDVSLSGVDAFQWSGYPLACDTCAIFSFMPDTSGVLVLNATLGLCSNTFSYPITVSELVVAGISGDTTLCAGDSLHLLASGGGSYVWSTGDTLASLNIAPQNTSYYSVVVSNGYCSDSAQVAVYVYPRPAVNAGEDTTIIFGQSAVLHGEASGALNWYPASFLSCTDCLEPIVNAPHTETYCLTTINSYGCSATDCMVLTVDTLCADLFIPNVFAPDEGGNAENNCFRLYGKDCIGTMTLTIYNRWGEKVYVSENPNDCWNGTFHDKPLNTGVFVYYLEATLITGESLSRQGNITLIR